MRPTNAGTTSARVLLVTPALLVPEETQSLVNLSADIAISEAREPDRKAFGAIAIEIARTPTREGYDQRIHLPN